MEKSKRYTLICKTKAGRFLKYHSTMKGLPGIKKFLLVKRGGEYINIYNDRGLFVERQYL